MRIPDPHQRSQTFGVSAMTATVYLAGHNHL